MPYANNQGIRIHYEVEGEGPPLVLAHGASGSMQGWHEFGYVDALRGDYHLILVDARGHGQSEKPHDPAAYAPELMANDFVCVLDDLNIGKADYFGYSMGAKIGFNAARHRQGRFHSFILGGMSPYREEAEVHAIKAIIDNYRLGLIDPEAYIAWRERISGRPLTTQQRARQLENDFEALIAVLTAAIDDPGLNNDDLLPIASPCLLYAGDADAFHPGATEAANHMPNATFFSMPGLDHVPAFALSDLALAHIKEFLANVVRDVSRA